MNSTSAIRRKLTIDKDAFSSTRNVTTVLCIFYCDLGQLKFSFLNDFNQLQELRILNSFNVGMVDWDIGVPSLQELYIENDEINKENSWNNNLLPIKCRITKLCLVGVGFSGDETANRILQWLQKSSAETLTDVKLNYWGNLTKIPPLLSFFKRLNRLEIICNNFEMPIIEENSIVFNVPFRFFSLKNCGIKIIKPGAFQGIGLYTILFNFE